MSSNKKLVGLYNETIVGTATFNVWPVISDIDAGHLGEDRYWPFFEPFDAPELVGIDIENYPHDYLGVLVGGKYCDAVSSRWEDCIRPVRRFNAPMFVFDQHRFLGEFAPFFSELIAADFLSFHRSITGGDWRYVEPLLENFAHCDDLRGEDNWQQMFAIALDLFALAFTIDDKRIAASRILSSLCYGGVHQFNNAEKWLEAVKVI